MDHRIDLDEAVGEVEHRRTSWQEAGLAVGLVTWRDQGEGWPPQIKTDREQVTDPDSIGVSLRKGVQEGEVVLFRGGWCDFLYWTGQDADDPIQDAPGEAGADVADFGRVLDRLAGFFR